MAKSSTSTTATQDLPAPPVDQPSQNAGRSSSPPEITFRVGRCSASVFINQMQSNGNGNGKGSGESRTWRFRSASVQRSFKDEKGDTQYTSSFGLGEIYNAIRVLQLAAEHMEGKESSYE